MRRKQIDIAGAGTSAAIRKAPIHQMMTPNPQVSVVMSSYNRSAALRTAVTALLAQRVPPDLRYEIIVVDNNSTDDTTAVLGELMRDPRARRLRTVFERRQGVSYGRNAGIAAARAPVIAFTDDDNVAASDWVERIRNAFDRDPSLDAIGGRVLPVWPTSVPDWIDRRHWSPLALLDFGERPVTTSSSYPHCMLTANLAVRREVLEQIGLFSPDYPRCQDHELLLRLWRAGRKAVYLPDLVVYATVPPERLTKRYHRQWHFMHGRHAAGMRLQEAIDGRGHLIARPNATPRLLGTPGHVFRDFVRHLGAWTRAVARFRRADAQCELHRISYFAAYIRESTSRTVRQKGHNVFIDVLTFLRYSAARGSRRVGIKLPRLVMIHGLLTVLVGGSAYDIYTGLEHWPLSPYPMFSSVAREHDLRAFRMVGVTAEDEPREIPVRDYGMLEPLDQCRVATAFARTVNNTQRRHLAEEMLRDRLAHYERHRLEKDHDGPPLRALRLYDSYWTLDAAGANADSPDRSELVAEVSSAAPHDVARRRR